MLAGELNGFFSPSVFSLQTPPPYLFTESGHEPKKSSKGKPETGTKKKQQKTSADALWDGSFLPFLGSLRCIYVSVSGKCISVSAYRGLPLFRIWSLFLHSIYIFYHLI